MKVSVIIPTYNEEKSVKACLESLAKQYYSDFEVIIVDDGSKDRTKRIVQSAKSDLKNINLRLLTQKHQGPAVARNLGASRAKGEILVFVDADMTFDRVFLKNIVAPIVSGRAKGTFSADETVTNWDNIWSRSWNANHGFVDKLRRPKEQPKRHPIFRAIKKSEFIRVSGFDKGGYTDDYSLSRKLGYEALLVDKARFYHKNPDSFPEVFSQARWAAKREYKGGKWGFPLVILRLTPPVTLLEGLLTAIKYKRPFFVVFKLVYNSAAMLGLYGYYIQGKGAK